MILQDLFPFEFQSKRRYRQRKRGGDVIGLCATFIGSENGISAIAGAEFPVITPQAGRQNNV